MKQNRWVNSIIEKLKELGAEKLEYRHKKHHVIACVLNGEKLRWTVSSTPGSSNSNKKAIAQLRSELRKCGISREASGMVKYMTGPFSKDSIKEELFQIIERWENHGSID